MSPRDFAKWSPASRRAFSFMEVMIVVMILGIVAAVTYPLYSKIGDAGRYTTAATRARSIATARESYALTQPNAATAWSTAANDTARVQLLISANLLSGTVSPADYLTSPGGYGIALGTPVRGTTSLTKGGAAVTF